MPEAVALTPRAVLARGLTLVGRLAYLICLAWTIPGSWILAGKALGLGYAMITYGVAPDEDVHDESMFLIFVTTAAYLMFFCRAISTMFWAVPIVKPVMFMGFVLFAGACGINIVIYTAINHGVTAPAALWGIGIAGFMLLRVGMSLFFRKYPAEWFALR